MEVDISDETLEVLFSKQMEQSTQLVEIMKDYNKGVMKKTNPRSYEYLRGEIDLHLSLERKQRARQRLAGTATQGQQFNATDGGRGRGGGGGKGGKPKGRRVGPGVCNQWAQAGACSRKGQPGGCQYAHLSEDQGVRKGRGKGKGKGEGKDGSGGKGKGDRGAGSGTEDRGRSQQRDKGASKGDRQSPARKQTPGARPRKCAYWDKDACRNGKNCTFDHPADCRDWKKNGACPKGKPCTYRHKTSSAHVASETEKEEQPQQEIQKKKVLGKRGLRRAKSKLKEATAYVATLQAEIAADKKD